ncbi:hypothetical protein SLEP1_g3206 [Rubroshorea leprosula]|uniref:Uncharacterized protein n=1 Tax=Rubroshorea leprosula TaxID=152421 RepID=A0AAV5HU02_9ROSI|nr:hypothetical protein SLEP1_g3206 [Rubroshorea leprosula]
MLLISCRIGRLAEVKIYAGEGFGVLCNYNYVSGKADHVCDHEKVWLCLRRGSTKGVHYSWEGE